MNTYKVQIRIYNCNEKSEEIKTKVIKTYHYKELSEEAKNRVRQDYIDSKDDNDLMIFTENCMECLSENFKRSDLKIEYSLSCCQGDGFNIYGMLDIKDVLENYMMKNVKDETKVYSLTEKEIKTLNHYADIINSIKLNNNNGYFYFCQNKNDIYYQLLEKLEDMYYSNINKELLKKFSLIIYSMIKVYCDEFETNGYKFLYEISDQDMEELSECNEWRYTIDGKMFFDIMEEIN